MSQVDAIHMEEDPITQGAKVTPFPDFSSRKDEARTSILVFTRDAALIDTVRKAAPRDATVIHAPDLDQTTEQLPALQPDVLVLDAAGTTDVPRMAAQLAQQFPDLVTIVAGRREESASLMKLTATGQIYRFLLVPLALGQTRLTLEAALRRHVERAIENVRPAESASTPPPGETGGRTKMMAAVAAAAVVAAAAGWYFLGNGTDEASVVTPATRAETSAAAPAAGPAEAELRLAAQAMERGQYVEPAGASALDHYRAALAIDANNAQARAGITAIADRIVEQAETALLAERLDQAVTALEIVRNIQPDHARLNFLDAQVTRERERLQLTQARDTGVRLRGILNVAMQRMESGRLLAPAGDSARDALLEARRLDATDPAVIQGFRNLTTRVLEDAQRAVAAGRADQATALLAGARELSPSDARIATLERALNERPSAAPAVPVAAAAPAESTLTTATALARARLGEGRLLDPAGDSARDHLLAARAADANNADVQRLLADFKNRLIESGRAAMTVQNLDEAQRFLRAAADLNFRGSDDALAGAQRDLDRQRAEREFLSNVVSAGSLNRTRTVPPQYPAQARRRGIEGWVDLVFTVTINGTVADVSVTGSNPPDVFDAAAIDAVRQWRFEPVVRSGATVSQRAATRLRFDLEN